MSWTTANYGYWEYWAPYDPANGVYGEHVCIFDGENKLIYINPEISVIDVKTQLYSDWKEWAQVRDNSKFLPAIRTTGGDPIGGGQFTGDIYFLINGWRVVVQHVIEMTGILFSDDYPSPYIIEFGGVVAKVSSLAIAYSTTGGSGATAAEVWAYNNRSLTTSFPTVPSVTQIRQEMDTNSTKLTDIKTKTDTIAAAPSAETIASAVRTELDPELTHLLALNNNPGLTNTQATMLLEMYELLGLDPTKPLVVTQSSRTAGTISQDIVSDNTQTVVTRVLP